MKSLFKLLIAALIANATWRIGSEYLSYYKFKDSVREFMEHRAAKTTDAQLRDRVLELANQYDIPVADEALTITQVKNHTVVEGAYVKQIDLVPTFHYSWPFEFHIDTFVTDPDEIAPPR